LTESSFQGFSFTIGVFGAPFFSSGIKEVVSPEFGLKFIVTSFEFSRIKSGESCDGEGPTFFSGTESD